MIPMTRFLRRRRAAHRSVAVGLALALMTGLAATAAGHGPDPVLGGPLFGQNQALLFDWRTGAAPPAAIKTAIRAAAADASSTRASKAATFAYDADGTNPIGYGVGATCGANGIACFTRNAPDGFTMWLREQGHRFDWGALKWCQSYASPPSGCFDVETIALDEFGHVEILNHHVNYADERDYDDAVVQRSRAAEAREGLEHAPLRDVRRRHAPAASTTCRARPRSTRAAWTCRQQYVEVFRVKEMLDKTMYCCTMPVAADR